MTDDLIRLLGDNLHSILRQRDIRTASLHVDNQIRGTVTVAGTGKG